MQKWQFIIGVLEGWEPQIFFMSEGKLVICQIRVSLYLNLESGTACKNSLNRNVFYCYYKIDMMNKVNHIGSGYPGKPFSQGENMACFGKRRKNFRCCRKWRIVNIFEIKQFKSYFYCSFQIQK